MQKSKLKSKKNLLVLVNLVIGLFLISRSSVFAAVITPVSVDTTSPVIGDLFSVTASISGTLLGNTFFVKCRIGPNSSTLTDGQTYNPQTTKWLDDSGSTGAWIDMPQVVVGSDGLWQGTIQCRIKSYSLDESKVLFVRGCLNSNNSCGTSFQSTAFLSLSPQVPTPTPSPTPTSVPTSIPAPTNTSAPTSTPKPQNSPTTKPSVTPVKIPTSEEVSSTESVFKEEGTVLGENVNKSSSGTSQVSNNTKSNTFSFPLLLGLLGGGSIFISIAIFLGYRQKFKDKKADV